MSPEERQAWLAKRDRLATGDPKLDKNSGHAAALAKCHDAVLDPATAVGNAMRL